MARKHQNPLVLENFDTDARYDIYFESARRLVALRDVRILGTRTWEEFDEPDDAAVTFLTLQDRNDEVVHVETDAVTLVAVTGAHVALEPVL